VHTVKLNVHPDDCTCERSPDCRGKLVVNMPDTGLAPKVFRDWDGAAAQMREYALNGPPVGEPGVRGPVHAPDHDRLKH